MRIINLPLGIICGFNQALFVSMVLTILQLDRNILGRMLSP